MARLVDAHILTARKVGRSNLLRPNPDNRLVGPLTEIVLATMGPHLIVGEAFVGIRGVSRLLIYGSWAARHHGQPGPPRYDLDLLVAGRPERSTVYAAAEAVEQRTGLTVNPVIASVKRWDDHADALITEINSSIVEIDLRQSVIGA